MDALAPGAKATACDVPILPYPGQILQKAGLVLIRCECEKKVGIIIQQKQYIN
ncbi:hypothetical protein [Sphingobium fluviale]|uniref:hypothetical protein n=1 Tax=Sphingobium fluviale TaxID=2506423 RepID=UPI0013E8FD65|nr:hypothetical protein [Sphingobium fluviale]